MTLEDKNVLIASIKQTLDRRIVVGDTHKYTPLTFLKLYLNLIDYCQAQIDSGDTTYLTQLRTLTTKVNNLKRRCSAICNLRGRGRTAEGEFTVGEFVDIEFTPNTYN